MDKKIKSIEINYSKLFKKVKKEKISLFTFMVKARLTPVELFLLKANRDIHLSTLGKVRKYFDCDIKELFDEKVIYQ